MVFLIVIVFWGASLLGVQLAPFQWSVVPREVALTPVQSPMVRTPRLTLTGTTKPSALITTIVDGSRQPFVIAGDFGEFTLSVNVPQLGIHRIRIEVAYESVANPDEVMELSIVRVPATIPTPSVVAVEALTDPRTFIVLLRGTPRTQIIATGAAVRDARIDETGRAQVVLEVEDEAAPVTLAARDVDGFTSKQTPELNLGELASQPPAVPAFEQAEWNVAYLVTRDNVTRTQTVTLDKRRPEVAELTRGAIDARRFIDLVSGPAGLAPVGNFGCLVSSVRSAQTELEIGDKAVITLKDEFPDLLNAWNGLSAQPRVSLCFPAGFPGIGNTGRIELKVRDYAVPAVTGAVESATRTPADAGVVERTYVWSSVARNGAIDVSLSLDTGSALAALPTVRPRSLIPEEGIGPILLGLIDGLIHGAGVLLLIWAMCSRAAKRALPEESRRALGDVLTIGAGLLFLPAFAGLQGLGVFIANNSGGIRDIAAEFDLAPTLLSRWLFAGFIVAVMAVVAWLSVRRSHEFMGRSSGAIGIGAGAWLVISIAGWIASLVINALTSDDLDADHAVRLTTWLIGATALTFAFFLISGRFGSFLGRRNRVAVVRGRLPRLGWAAVVGSLVALPAGTAQDITTSQENVANYIESTIGSLGALIAFAFPLVAITAVACMVRAAWEKTPWEKSVPVSDEGIVDTGGSRNTGSLHLAWLAPQLGRALFAGFVIGTAGILLPIPFVLALLLFRFMLRPARDIISLAKQAPMLRTERKALILAALGDAGAKHRLEQFGRTTTAEAAEIGPEPSIWGNVKLALRWALVLMVPLLLVYLLRYPFVSMTPQDEFYLQRFVFNSATFAGTWLTVALGFALLYEYLRGTTGVRKGLGLGFAILAFTVPWQLLSGLATTLSPVAIGIHVLEVVTFTGLLGAVFDLRLIQQASTVRFGRPRAVLRDLGVVSGLPDLAAAVGLLLTALVTTAVSLATGQVTQLLTRVLSPFLPMPPSGGP